MIASPKLSPPTFVEKMKTLRILSILVLVSLIAIMNGCCKRGTVQTGFENQSSGSDSVKQGNAKKQSGGKNANLVEQPLDILSRTGLNYSIDSKGNVSKGGPQKSGVFFETKYTEGIDLMEKGEFTKAVSIFEAIVERYPNSEEASVAELCIAELYFRNKSNSLALQAYEKIVENYPNSHAAENAKAGIKYLKDFEIYEKEHISSDIEDRKRRGF